MLYKDPENGGAIRLIHRTFTLAMITTIAAATFSSVAIAQCEITEVHALDPGERARFGYSLDMDGNLAAIGALADPGRGYRAGAVYVYRFTPDGPDGPGWVQQQKLTGHDTTTEDNFGIAVDIDATPGSPARIIVGAHEDDDMSKDSGSAYIFLNDPPGSDQWIQEAKLLAPDGGPYNLFGCAVGIDGDMAIVGARRKGAVEYNSGAVYVYENDGAGTWSFTERLVASEVEGHDEFGSALDFSMKSSTPRLIVGTYFDDDMAQDAGAVYVYHHDGTHWIEDQKLTASDGEKWDWFGRHVDLDNTSTQPRLIAGSWRDEDHGEFAGAAYVFRYDDTDGWIEEQKLLASDGAEYDCFGYAVAIEGETVLVGAYSDDDGEELTGSAYVYRYDGTQWNEEMKLHPADAQYPDAFGKAVALSNNIAVIGADQDHDSGLINTGSAYFFGDLDGRGLALLSPTPGAAGETNHLSTVCGTPDTPVYFIYGLHEGSTGVPGCAGLSVDIADPLIAGSATADDTGFADLTRFVPIFAQGQTIYLQAVVPQPTCNVSNRIRWTFR